MAMTQLQSGELRAGPGSPTRVFQRVGVEEPSRPEGHAAVHAGSICDRSVQRQELGLSQGPDQLLGLRRCVNGFVRSS
jgi:hypothetical protein